MTYPDICVSITEANQGIYGVPGLAVPLHEQLAYLVWAVSELQLKVQQEKVCSTQYVSVGHMQ